MSSHSARPQSANETDASQLHLMNHVLQDNSEVIATCQGWFNPLDKDRVCPGDRRRPVVMNVVAATSDKLILYTLSKNGKLNFVAEQQFYTHIRQIAKIPCLDEQHVDYVAITTDSGHVQALQFCPANDGLGPQQMSEVSRVMKYDPIELRSRIRKVGTWEVVASMMVGKSGVKRTVPAAHLAVDPYGRCLMVSALEKHKFVIPIDQKLAPDVLEFDGEDSGGAGAGTEDKVADNSMDTNFRIGRNTEVKSHRARSGIERRQRISFGTPCEAHKSCIIQSICEVSSGVEEGANPIFACLELPCGVDGASSSAATTVVEKEVAFYQYEQGIKNIIRVYSTPVKFSSHLLLSLPSGGRRCPGEVLVCAESEIRWLSHEASIAPSPWVTVPARAAAFPPRTSAITGAATAGTTAAASTTGLIFQGGAYFKFAKKGDFFLLIQDELGDLFRVEMKKDDEDNLVSSWSVSVCYMDSLPSPCSSFLVEAIRNSGFLLTFNETGNHVLYEIKGDGEPDDRYLIDSREVVVPSSSDGGEDFKEDTAGAARPSSGGGAEVAAKMTTTRKQPLFNPSLTQLRDLEVRDTITHLGPLAAAHYVPKEQAIAGKPESGGHLVTLSGKTTSSHFSVLKYGKPIKMNGERPWDLPVATMNLLTSRLYQGRGTRAVMTADQVSIFLDVSTPAFVQEDAIANQVLIKNQRTLAIADLAQDCGFLQITPGILRHVFDTETLKTRDWQHPLKKTIVAAAANPYQAVICFAQGGGMYFRLSLAGGKKELEPIGRVEAHVKDVIDVVLPPADSVSIASFVGILYKRDFTICALGNSGAEQPFKPLDTRQTFSLANNDDLSVEFTSAAFLRGPDGRSLSVIVAQNDGYYSQMDIDPEFGYLQKSTMHRCGHFGPGKPCRVIQPAVNATGRTFIHGTGQVLSVGYSGDGAVFTADPYCDETISAHTDLVEVIEDNDPAASTPYLLGLSGPHLTVYDIPLAEDSTSLSYTHTELNKRSLPVQGKRMKVVHMVQGTVAVLLGSEPRCGGETNMWGNPQRTTTTPTLESCGGRSLDFTTSVIHVVDLSGQNKDVNSWKPVPIVAPDTAMCLDTGAFDKFGKDPLLVVGTARNLKQNPMQHDGGAILVYRFQLTAPRPAHVDPLLLLQQGGAANGGAATSWNPIEHVLYTPFPNDVPLTVHCFRGGLLAGFAGQTNGVMFFELGQKALLRKEKIAVFQGPVTSLASRGDLIAVGDASAGVNFVSFEPKTSRSPARLSLVAEEKTPRQVTQLCFVDDNTVAVTDKFGLISFLRFPPSCPTLRERDFGLDRSLKQEIPKLMNVANFYAGGLVSSLSPLRLLADKDPSRRDAGGVSSINTPAPHGILYSTLSGTIGALVPFKTDAEFSEMYFFQRSMRKKSQFNPNNCLSTHTNLEVGPDGNPLLEVSKFPPVHRGVGLEHRTYRSLHSSGSEVIDGTLLEKFHRLPTAEQTRVKKNVSKQCREANELYEEKKDEKRVFTKDCDSRYHEIRGVFGNI